MRLHDLGTVAVEIDGQSRSVGGAKLAAILALLLIHANRRVSADAVMDSIWGESVSAGTSSTLESHIWRLRQLLEPGRPWRAAPSVVMSEAGGYRLLVDDDQVDSLRFEQLADQARVLLGGGDPDRALRRCDTALALWRGRPFGQSADSEWAMAAVGRLEEVRAQLSERRVEALLMLGEPEPALTALETLIAEMPYRERLWGQRMVALYRTGRTEEALLTYQRARTMLLEEVGLEPGAELQDLQRRILDQDPSLVGPAHAPTGAATSRGGLPRPVEIHLPARVTPLIGRAGEVEQLSSLVGARPMVTITGAAGCGKTRLAIEVARAAAAQFPDGVWFVDLSTVGDGALVVDLVVSTLGLTAAGAVEPLASLGAFARDRRMLLVLDNCEHLVAAVSSVAHTVLADDAECSVLATSREPVGVDGETVWSLLPLSLPETDDDTDPATVGLSPAVELFLARVHAADPNLALDVEDLRVAAAICVAVDGLPLAIELAAARIRSSTLAEIAEQVSTDIGRLRPLNGRADHRQSLLSTIEWSHRLLSPTEQVLHRRLSVLPGAFTRGAAVTVAAADPLVAADVTDLLPMLVHRSMLTSSRALRPGGPTLFRQLATVRGHAAQALAQAAETDPTVARRDDWVRALMQARPQLGHADDAGWYDTVEDGFATVRATLQHTLVEQPDGSGTWMVSRLFGFWLYRARLVEARRWLQLAIAQPSADPIDVSICQLSLALTHTMQRRIDLARPYLDSALATTATVGPERDVEVTEALVAVATYLSTQSALESMGHVATRVSEIAQLSGDREIGVLNDALSCLTDTSTLGLDADPGRAETVYHQGLAAGNLFAGWIAAAARCGIALLARDGEQGAVWTERTAQIRTSLGDRTLNGVLDYRANFAAVSGDYRRAARLYAATRQQARRVGATWPLRAITSEIYQQTREALSVVDFEQACRQGEQLTVADLLPGAATGSDQPR